MARRTKQNRQGIKWQYRFLLNIGKEGEAALADFCEYLLDYGLFVSTIRDALRLIKSLRDRDVSILLELFPQVEEWFREKFIKEGQGGGNDDIKQQLARLEQLVIQQGTGGDKPTLIQRSTFEGAVKSDDFNLEIKQATSDAGNNSTFNFLISMTLNSQGNVNGLEAKVIEYGVKTGRIPAGMVASHKPAQAAVSSGNAKAIAGAGELPPPVYDDDFDLEIRLD